MSRKFSQRNSKNINEILQSNSGILTPQATTAEINTTITSSRSGQIIYDTTTNELKVFNGTSWDAIGGSDLGNILISGNTISTTTGDLTISANGTSVIKLEKTLNANSQNISGVAFITADKLTCPIVTGLNNPVANSDVVTKGYLESIIDDYLPLSGGTLTGAINANTNNIVNVANLSAITLAGLIGTAAQTNITSLGTLTELKVDNINIDENIISATNSDGSIILSPKGTGVIQITKTLDANTQNITNVATIGPCFTISMNGSITSIGNTNITITPGGTGVIRAGKALDMQTFNITNAGTVTATTLAGTLSTAAQTNITSLGTLTALNVDNINIDVNTISTTNTNGNLILAPNGTGIIQLSKTLNANSQNISGVATLTATTLAGTLSTAAQTNITSLGTLTALNVDNINIDGSVINNTDTGAHLTLQSSSTLGVRINNFKTPFCQITTSSTYTTQNVNLTGMSMSASSSYSLFTLTSGTTLTVSESMDALMIMNASFSDDANERLVAIELYENGVFITSGAGAIPYLDTNTSFTSVSVSRVFFLTAGRSYTWRFSSASQGTADLRSLIVYVTRV